MYIIFYIILSIVIIILFEIFTKIKRKLYLKKDIVTSFDKSIPYTNINIDLVKEYYRSLDLNTGIDDITSNDIELDTLFKTKFNLQSFIGMNTLYKILRHPIYNIDELKERDSLISYFQKNKEDRFKVQFLLRSILGRKNTMPTLSFKNSFFKEKLMFLKIYKFIFILSLIFVTLIVYISKDYFVFFILLLEVLGIIGLNILFKQEENNYNIEASLAKINEINCARKIYNLNIDILNNRFKDIEKSLSVFKSISKRKISSSIYSSTDLIVPILKVFRFVFLDNIIDTINISNLLLTNEEDFDYIYNYLGEIDSFIGVAFFRNSLNISTSPIYKETTSIEFTNLYNPLIKKSISNSLAIESSALITGVNASGKSTFLRTIGLNIVLGQTISTVCAKEFKTKLCNLVTSISLNDSITKGDSFYISEIKGLKRMVILAEKEIFSVFLIDEILKGTNTLDRVSGSSAILEFLSDKNCIFLVATHDLELPQILKNKVNNFKFEGIISNKDILFDYKVKFGVTKTRNALELLRIFGFDYSILKNMRERIINFKKNNKWS